jgi:hypothetical protein
MSAPTLRLAILGATTLPRERVLVPELGLGEDVFMQGMSGTQRDAFEASLVVTRGRKRDINTQNLRARLVAYCAVDGLGDRIFSDDDVEPLGRIRADLLNRMFTVAQRLSGLTDEDVDELGKPSSPAASSGSSSASPASSA